MCANKQILQEKLNKSNLQVIEIPGDGLVVDTRVGVVTFPLVTEKWLLKVKYSRQLKRFQLFSHLFI